MHDVSQTIAAPASAALGGARAIVRVSGRDTVAILQKVALFAVPANRRPSVISAEIFLQANTLLPIEIWLWPTSRSYTRQPLAEIHLPGSQPLVELLLERLLAAGSSASPAGGIHAASIFGWAARSVAGRSGARPDRRRDESSFQAALAQLAGGFSTPLEKLRGELLDMLAEP